MTADALTDRQREVLAAIEQYIRAYGYPPSFRELGALMGVTSTNAVEDVLAALERRGYIRRTPRIARGIVIVKGATA